MLLLLLCIPIHTHTLIAPGGDFNEDDDAIKTRPCVQYKPHIVEIRDNKTARGNNQKNQSDQYHVAAKEAHCAYAQFFVWRSKSQKCSSKRLRLRVFECMRRPFASMYVFCVRRAFVWYSGPKVAAKFQRFVYHQSNRRWSIPLRRHKCATTTMATFTCHATPTSAARHQRGRFRHLCVFLTQSDEKKA